MAMTDSDRFAVFATAKEAIGLIFSNLMPYLLLVIFTAVPWVVGAALGAFDALGDYSRRMGEFEGTAAMGGYGLEGYPFGNLVLMWVGGFFTMAIFGIFLMRYTLLGRDGALKFTLGQFNAMFWRSMGYGLAATLIGILVFVVTLITVGFTGGLISGLLSVALGPAALIVMVPFVIVAYALPLAVMVRISLPFPAIALGLRMSFKDSWSVSKGATWRIVGAVVVAGLPFAILGYAVQFALVYGLFGVILWDPVGLSVVLDNWWIMIVLAPLNSLPLALVMTIIAIAYRDLSGPRSVELPAGASLA